MNITGRYVVLGGGISGLVAANHLLAKVSTPSNITIIESSSRLGGWIQSKRYEDGTLFELGPRSLRPGTVTGITALQLAHNLGLENEIVAVSSKESAAKNRFIYAHGQLHKLPYGLLSLFRPQKLLRTHLLPVLLKEMFIPNEKGLADESIESFITRRFNQEISDYVIDPMIRGIFAGDIRKLSIKSCLPPVYNLEKTSGSVVKGILFPKGNEKLKSQNPLVKKALEERWSMWSLRNGLESLVEELEQKLVDNGVKILKNKELSSLSMNQDKTMTLHFKQSDEVLVSDHIFTSIPPKNMASLLPTLYSPLCDLLCKLVAVSVAVVNVEFESISLEYDGFGYLYPSCESPRVLGVIFDSCTFPNGDSKMKPSTRFTVLLGGDKFQQEFGEPEAVDKDQIKSIALGTLKTHLNVCGKPSKLLVSIHKDCIPQYYVGHSELIHSLRSNIMDHDLPLSLIGAWYDGVGLNDCIHYSQHSVDKLFM